jgi:hypothetical protein
VGDVTTQPGWLAVKVADQVPVLISNLKADVLGNGKQLTYSPKQKMAMPVPVSQATGTGEMFGWVPWGKMISMIKGKDFFVSRARGFISAKYTHLDVVLRDRYLSNYKCTVGVSCLNSRT